MKWLIWVPWIVLVVFGVVRAGGYSSVQPFYGTVGGISVAGDASRPVVAAYAIYFAVVLLFFGLSLAVGRRGGCHTVCWMAPFMILGREARNRLGAWPSLRLVADSPRCTQCGTCTSVVPHERRCAGARAGRAHGSVRVLAVRVVRGQLSPQGHRLLVQCGQVGAQRRRLRAARVARG